MYMYLWSCTCVYKYYIVVIVVIVVCFVCAQLRQTADITKTYGVDHKEILQKCLASLKNMANERGPGHRFDKPIPICYHPFYPNSTLKDNVRTNTVHVYCTCVLYCTVHVTVLYCNVMYKNI